MDGNSGIVPVEIDKTVDNTEKFLAKSKYCNYIV